MEFWEWHSPERFSHSSKDPGALPAEPDYVERLNERILFSYLKSFEMADSMSAVMAERQVLESVGRAH